MIEIDDHGNIRLELCSDGPIVKYLMPTGIKTYYVMKRSTDWFDTAGYINNSNGKITVKVE